jgi:hypothetical protein
MVRGWDGMEWGEDGGGCGSGGAGRGDRKGGIEWWITEIERRVSRLRFACI